MARNKVDWDALEPHYRAGIRSFGDMAAEFGVSDAGIIKHAKVHGWTRNLAGKIKAAADSKVAAALVKAERLERIEAGEVLEQTAEEVRVEVESEVQARIRLAHRADITRFRKLVINLLAECEGEAEDAPALAQLGELMRQPDERGQDRLNEAYQKAVSLPTRIKGIKDLADTLKTLVGMEREAYGIDKTPPPAEEPEKFDPMEGARRIAFALAKAAHSLPTLQ
jgi:hypothetical protein